MSIHDIIRTAMHDVAVHLGEWVTIDGHDVRGFPRQESGVSAGLTVQVSSMDKVVTISTEDAERIGLAEGMVVETWKRIGSERRLVSRNAVRNFVETGYGRTIVELS